MIDSMGLRKAKAAALNLLSDLGYQNPPIDPIDIAISLGVNVLFSNFGSFDNVAGFYDSENNKIYVNKDELPHRQTLIIAHELGHIILHKDWTKSKDYKVLLRENLEFPSQNQHDNEASTFAVNLLVPKYLLNKYSNIASKSELAKLFVVSRVIIQKRLNQY